LDRPEIFGLYLNADITFQTKESAGMFEMFISLQPRTGGGRGVKSSDEVVGEVFDDLVARMPCPRHGSRTAHVTCERHHVLCVPLGALSFIII
jgi:hypothetical protein